MKKKRLAALLALALTLSLAACSPGENTPPEITGVADQTAVAGSEFDVMAGVSASDGQEGDMTSKVTITSMPELSVQNGKVTPERAGSYELTYSVTDKGGLTAEAYATLTVTRQTGEAVVYKKFDFSTQTADSKGWEVRVADGASASGELKQGAYVFEIASPGSAGTDVQLVKSVPLKAADYRVVVYAKSTKETRAGIQAGSQSASGLLIGTETAPIELSFPSSGEGTADVAINLGKGSDAVPQDFTVTIDKIEIFESSGTETRNPVYTGGPELTVSAGDGAAAAVSGSGVEISAYPSNGGVWSIRSDIALPNLTVEAGQKYYYSFTLEARNGQSGECLVESSAQADANRVSFNSFSAGAGEKVTVSAAFTAEQAVADPVIRLQIGAPSDGVTSNSIQISDLQFGTVSGDLKTVKTIDAFTPFGKGAVNEANPDYPWTSFNGTDEDNERGVGTTWTENGSFFYRIDQGGTTDWHNKLSCGYTENPVTLESDSYYIVEITAKATKDVSCSFFLNPLGSWDPRISAGMDITTQEQTFTFETTDTFVTNMDFELLFQFGSEKTAQLGEVTIEFSNVTIYQKSVL